jgi:hypothetical protein
LQRVALATPQTRSGRWRSGLVNNIPDAAFEATERQFVEVLGAAAGPNLVRLHLFSLERCIGGSP